MCFSTITGFEKTVAKVKALCNECRSFILLVTPFPLLAFHGFTTSGKPISFAMSCKAISFLAKKPFGIGIKASESNRFVMSLSAAISTPMYPVFH